MIYAEAALITTKGIYLLCALAVFAAFFYILERRFVAWYTKERRKKEQPWGTSGHFEDCP